VIHQSDEWEEDCLAGGGLDDGALADTGGVQINVGALFCGFGGDIEIEDLYYVANEVWELSEFGRRLV
jgi:hypothetical protein